MNPDIEEIVDRSRVVDVLNALFIATDERDWPKVKRCFAPSVRFDMSSSGGGAPSTKTPDEIAALWEAGLKPLTAAHHQVGNYVVHVAAHDATAFCYGLASHYRPHPTGRNTRTFVGSYDFGLQKSDGAWRITRFKFNLKYLDGNAELESTADTPAPAAGPAEPAPATLVDVLVSGGFRQIPVSVSSVGHIHAAGTLNGRPVSVLLDTGGAATLVHLALAREMGLKLDKLPFQGGGAGTERLDIFQLPEATLLMRDVAPRVRALLAMDLKHVNDALAQKGQPPVEVIVGADVFEAHAAVIDYGSRSVFLKA